MERLLLTLSHRVRRYVLLIRSVSAVLLRHSSGSLADRQRRYFRSRMRVLHRRASRYEMTDITRLDRDAGDTAARTFDRGAVWEIRLTGPRGIRHSVGDTLLLRWSNPPHLVDEIIGILQCADTRRYPIITHSSVFQPGRLRYARLRRILEEDIELRVAGPQLLDRLGYGASHPLGGNGLDRLAPQHVGDGRGVSLTATLRSATPPIGPRELLRLQPRTTARAYSLSRVERGGRLFGRDRVEIIVSAAETKVKEPDGAIVPADGRATAFVRRLHENAQPRIVHAWSLRHPWRLDTQQSERLVIIVTGTGIAGALAWLRERTMHGTGATPTSVWLIFGVRAWSRYGLYQEELLDYRRRSIIDEMDIAQSRSEVEEPSVTDAGARLHHCTRVTDVVARRRETFTEWLAAGAALYVSGTRAMGSAVRREIVSAAVHAGLAREADDAQRHITAWEEDGRAQFSIS